MFCPMHFPSKRFAQGVRIIFCIFPHSLKTAANEMECGQHETDDVIYIFYCGPALSLGRVKQLPQAGDLCHQIGIHVVSFHDAKYL